MDILKSLGELAIGSRLKRLSDVIMRDGVKIYQANGIDFQPRWFPVFYSLSQHSQLSVTEIAKKLGLTHPTVSQTLKELEEAGFISAYVPFAKKSKDTIYRLSDEYSLFYLKWVENKRSSGAGSFLKKFNTPGGSPASSKISTSFTADNGVAEAGL